MWDRAESNRRHMDFQSIALPTELQSQHVEAIGQANYLANEEHKYTTLFPINN